jgi:hypothetical protein
MGDHVSGAAPLPSSGFKLAPQFPVRSLSVVAGQIGDGQTASALTVAELTGTVDTWDDYVELSPSSRIVCSYTLPAGSAVTSLALQTNFRGPTDLLERRSCDRENTGSSNCLSHWAANGSIVRAKEEL